MNRWRLTGGVVENGIAPSPSPPSLRLKSLPPAPHLMKFSPSSLVDDVQRVKATRPTRASAKTKDKGEDRFCTAVEIGHSVI